ncbi:MAG: hypothetical protein HQ511_09215 [Rhodospirillales bacterium]|nr:hypothetical protein [Rhodospirillales bacterium]
MTESRLPEGFEDLEPFVAQWVLPTSTARSRKRHATPMDEIHAFYDAVQPRLKEVLTHLNTVPYADDMPDDERRLLELTLSLAEITTAVEWYGQQQVVDGFDPERLVLTTDFP